MGRNKQTFRDKIRKQIFDHIKGKNCDYIVPISIVGGVCDFWEYFLPWLEMECDKETIEIIDKPTGVCEAFQQLCKKKDIKQQINWFDYNKLIFLPEDECIIGVPLNLIQDTNSIKRIKIDVREDLEKLHFLEKEDPPESINLYNDVYICQ